VDWLREKRNADQPSILFVHFFDPHDPYDPPEQFKQQLDIPKPNFDRWGENRRYAMIAKYDVEIASGRVLSEPIEMVDIAPAILDVIDLDVDGESSDAAFHGRSLVPALSIENPEPLDPGRPIFLYRQHFREWEEDTIRSASWVSAPTKTWNA